MKIWLWVLSILFIGSAAAAGYFYYQDKYVNAKKPTKDLTAEKAAPCEEELSTFTGSQVKITFDYPASWGEATEKIINSGDSDEDVVQVGKTFEISFSKNPFLTFNGASPDFESAGIGGVCPIRPFVSSFDKTCANLEETSGDAVKCETLSVDNQAGVKYYYLPNMECMNSGVQRVAYLPIPDETFPAMVAEMRLPFLNDLNMNDLASRVGGNCGVTTGLENMFNTQRTEIQTALTADDLPYLPKKQVDELNALFESLQFND